MYITLYDVTVHPIGDSPVEFVDSNDTPGAGSAALAQLTAHKDVDSVIEGDGDIFHVIIPYHAIDFIEVVSVRTEEEDPVDDNAKNCTESGGDGGTGTLTIINDTLDVVNATILASAALSGTYGPLTFSTDLDQPFPTGYQSYAMITDLGAGASLEVPGLPVGTTLNCGNITATVPGELILMR